MMGSRRSIRFSLYAAVIIAMVFTLASGVLAAGFGPGKYVEGRRGAVAAAHELAAQAGLEMLKKGGNAVDAAVASAFAIGVVEPQASGLGGEGIMVIYLAKEKKSLVIDFKSAIPKGAEVLGDKRAPSKGYQSICVPGTVAGLTTALEKYGTKTLAEVLAPAIRLAEQGFPCPRTLAELLNDTFAAIMEDEGLSKVYLKDGLPMVEGDWIKNQEYANTLRKIAQGGADAFYKGEIADIIDAEMKKGNGYLAKEDLMQYKAIVREPISSTYRDYTIVTTPPPVTSVALLMAMNVMENFDLASRSNLSAENIHVISEAIRQGNTDRRVYVGDPAFMKTPVEEMLSKEYAKSIAKQISFEKVRKPKEQLNPGVFKTSWLPFGQLAATGTEGPVYESPSTTHISVVDRHQNMVAVTHTLSSFFGSGVTIKGTGIVMNNQMGNVFGTPTGPTGIQGGKRVITTISPSLVFKGGKPYMTIGSPGASRIMTTMAILFSNILDHKMPLDKAIDAPRFHPTETNVLLEIEGRIPVGSAEKLKALGYNVSVRPDYDLYFGGVQAVMINDRGRFIGAADPRRDGAAIAY